MRKTYDPRCKTLAEVFLSTYLHTEGDLEELAWAIQDTIDSCLEGFDPLETADAE